MLRAAAGTLAVRGTRWGAGRTIKRAVRQPRAERLQLRACAESVALDGIPAKDLERFFSNQPRVVLGVSASASKKAIKKAYHKLALVYHPDNPKTGNGLIMNRINLAFQKVASGEEHSETMADAAGEQKAQQDGPEDRARERQRQRQTYGETEEQRKKREAFEEEAVRKRRRRAKLGNRRRTQAIEDLGGTPSLADQYLRRPDGTFIYRLQGDYYETKNYIHPLDIQYHLIRKAKMDPAVLERYGLKRMGSVQEQQPKEMRRLMKEYAHAQRSVPFLYSHGPGEDARYDEDQYQGGVRTKRPPWRFWSQSNVVEKGLVAVPALWLLHWLVNYVCEVSALSDEFRDEDATVLYGNDELQAAVRARRERRNQLEAALDDAASEEVKPAVL